MKRVIVCALYGLVANTCISVNIFAALVPQSSVLAPNAMPKPMMMTRPIGYYDKAKAPQAPQAPAFNFKDIIGKVEDFVQNYLKQNTSLKDSMQSALEHIPFRSLGLTIEEMNQIKDGKITEAVRNTLRARISDAINLFNKIQPQLQNLPIVIELVYDYLTKIVKPEHITPDLKNALDKVKDFALKNNALLMNFGIQLAAIIAKNQNYLLKNLNIDQINAASINEIIKSLNDLANLIKPDVETLVTKLIDGLNKVDQNQLTNLVNAFKAIDFSNINVQAQNIENDVSEFLKQNVPGFM